MITDLKARYRDVKTGVKQVGTVAKTLGRLGVAVATEPFTNKILKANTKAIDQNISQQEKNTRERLTNRYPSK